MQPAVILVSNSGNHQARLAEALARAGVLRQAVRASPVLEIVEPDGQGGLRMVRRFPSQRIGNRLLWAVWWRLPVPWRGVVPLRPWGHVADRRIARHLAPGDVFHGLMGFTVASLQRARRQGAVTLIDNSTLHPAAFRRAVLEDRAEAGVTASEAEPVMPPSEVARCERQYQVCDRIIVYSAAAARSFEPYAYGGKTVVVNPGVDHNMYAPATVAHGAGAFRVGYVGRIEAAKGIHHLMQAWRRLALPDSELVLAGRVLPEMTGTRTEGAGVQRAGIQRAEGVVRLLRGCDLFVFPSVNEGLSLAVLEAMSCGVPVVACKGTGAEDCVTSEQEGLLVPGKDPAALANAIQWCYQHRDELRAMGRAARARVEREFTLEHYVGRLMDLYRSVGARDRME